MSPLLWKVCIILGLIAAAYTKGCSDEAARGAEFKATVEATSKLAQTQHEALGKRNRQLTRSLNEKHKSATDVLVVDLDRLRDVTSRPFIPTGPAPAGRLDLVCYGREELDREIRAVDEAFQGILGKAASCAIDLNTAKAWAAGLSR